jgi:hypothetical protein
MTDFWTTADEIPALLGAYVLPGRAVAIGVFAKPTA